MKNSLDTSFEITKLVKFSPKRESYLKEIIAEDISTFYKKLKNLWDWCLSEYGKPDIKGRVIGIKTPMKSFNFFFVIRLGHLILSHSDK